MRNKILPKPEPGRNGDLSNPPKLAMSGGEKIFKVK